jgi:hypothetical protein
LFSKATTRPSANRVKPIRSPLLSRWRRMDLDATSSSEQALIQTIVLRSLLSGPRETRRVFSMLLIGYRT